MHDISLICFIIALIVFVIFLILIRNVSPEFVKLYSQIMGFKHYMEIAESGRARLSNVFDKERLFCDNLDYAYAFGLGHRVIDMFPARFDSKLVINIDTMYSESGLVFLTK